MTPAIVEGAGARVFRWVGRWPFWAMLIGASFAFPVVRAMSVRPPVPPRVLGRVSDFALVDQDGHPYGTQDLRGRVWVANFIFTRCPTICPSFMQRMAEVRHRTRNLGDAFRLVTFTVDPENDTPARLAEYGRRFRVSPRRWHLLTGPEPALRRVVVDTMKIAMGREEAGGGGRDVDPTTGIFHGTRFVLVDQQARIRGYYEPTGPGVDRLMSDVGILVNTRD